MECSFCDFILFILILVKQSEVKVTYFKTCVGVGAVNDKKNLRQNLRISRAVHFMDFYSLHNSRDF